MSTRRKQKRWFPVTPTHSSGSHTEEEGGDLKELELPELTKDLESNLLNDNDIHHNAAPIFEPRVQTSKAIPLFDHDQDSPLS